MKKATNNISSLRNGLNSLIKRTTKNEIVIKPADKGSIITVMSPEFYLNMCESHLRNEEYECILTENECKTLTQKKLQNFKLLHAGKTT